MFSSARTAEANDLVEILLLVLGLVACGLAVAAGYYQRIAACVACGVLGVVLLILVL